MSSPWNTTVRVRGNCRYHQPRNNSRDRTDINRRKCRRYTRDLRNFDGPLGLSGRRRQCFWRRQRVISSKKDGASPKWACEFCIMHFASSLLRIFLATLSFLEFLYGILLVLSRCCFHRLVENSILYKKDIQHFCIGPILFQKIKSYGRWSAENLTVKFYLASGVRNRKFYLARDEKRKNLFATKWQFRKFYLAVKGLICTWTTQI